MREQVERPDIVDVDDTDMRDIRYRLNVLDHKLDTVMSTLGHQVGANDELAESLESISRNYPLMLDTMEHVRNYMERMNESTANVGSRPQGIEEKQIIFAAELAVVVAALRVSDGLLRSIHAKVGADFDARLEALPVVIADNC